MNAWGVEPTPIRHQPATGQSPETAKGSPMQTNLPVISPDGGHWWDGHRWLPTATPPTEAPVRVNVSLPRWAHWLIPAALVVLGIFLLGSAPAARDPFGLATDQSIGDVVTGAGSIAMALGYCLGRGVAYLQRKHAR